MVRSSYANLIHSYDAALLHLYLSTIDYPAVTIHDAVGVHANNVAKAQRQLTDKLIELEDSDPLNVLVHGGRLEELSQPTPIPDTAMGEAIGKALGGTDGSTRFTKPKISAQNARMLRRHTSVINPDHIENFS